eukprot:3131923-Pleurochrysis_carterae.AAC.2
MARARTRWSRLEVEFWARSRREARAGLRGVKRECAEGGRQGTAVLGCAQCTSYMYWEIATQRKRSVEPSHYSRLNPASSPPHP